MQIDMQILNIEIWRSIFFKPHQKYFFPFAVGGYDAVPVKMRAINHTNMT